MRVHDVACVRRDTCSGCNLCVIASFVCSFVGALLLRFLLCVCHNTRAMPVPLLPICKEVGLPDVIAKSLHDMGYDSPETFRSSFVDTAALESWLGRARPKLGEAVADVDDEDWSTHSMAGKLRRLWSRCGPCLPTAVASKPPCSALALFGESALPQSSQRLDAGDRERLLKDFEKRFPGLALCASTLPSLGLLQCVQSQCKSKAWTWVPWKRILSEEAALDVQSRRATRKRDMAEIVAEAAGLCSDEWDLDLSASPYKVQTLLTVRAHAYAMSEAGHLHSWMSYVNKFMIHYTRRPGLGLRPPSPAEAEEADKEVLGEIFRMVFHDDVSIDDALQSVVREDLLRVKLMPQPKPLKAPPPPSLPSGPRPSGAGGKRTKGGKEAPDPRKRYKKGNCWGFQEGSCPKSAKDCKFWRCCDKCGSPDHGAADCKA